MRRFLKPALLAIISVSTILVFLLILVSRNTSAIEKYYTPLIGVTTGVTALFAFLIVLYFVRLSVRAKKGRYGVRLLGKITLALVLSGIIPGLLIFFTSVQFLYKSVDSWFDVRVERALDAGLTLGREVIDNAQRQLLRKAVRTASEIAKLPQSNWIHQLDVLREKEACDEAVIVNSSGTIIGASGKNYDTLVPVAPTSRMLQEVMNEGYKEILNDSDEKKLEAKVIVPIVAVNFNFDVGLLQSKKSWTPLNTLSPAAKEVIQSHPQYFLVLTDDLPSSITANAETLIAGYRDYQEMVLTRDGLRTIYMTTLTLVLLLSLFGAAALSTYLGTRISRPLTSLLEGTQKVGEGHYEMVKESQSNDEVGELTRSFNIMIAQLATARKDLESRGEELEQAKTYLERILSKMSSGVIVLDANWKIVSLNPSASRIMKMDLVSHLGDPLGRILPAFDETIHNALSGQTAETPEISLQTELILGTENPKRIVVFVRGTPLLIGNREGYLLVFDDITRLAAAQRTEAWGEVARRLAHEIKNPLTPIRLAAERLQFKLDDKLTGKENEILNKATKTIVDQVNAMKQMVDDFRLYARLGAPKYEKMNLGNFVREVTGLYEAANFHVEVSVDPEAPEIEGDPNQLRQALHNLFSNATEAARPDAPMEVTITVSAVRDEFGYVNGTELRFEDNGTGFPDQILDHAFEPYVTTKVSGTGLGLPMIKKITEEHGGTVGVENIFGKNGEICGAAIFMIFRTLSQ